MVYPEKRWVVLAGLLCATVGWAEPVELTGPLPAWSTGGVTLLPIRPVADWLGATLSWDGAARTLSGSRDRHGETLRFSLTLGAATAVVNGKPVGLARPAEMSGEQVVVPARFAADGLGTTVAWDPRTRRVNLGDGEREAFIAVMRPVYPVVWAGILLGGRADGRWIGPGPMAKLLAGGESYWLYDFHSALGRVTGNQPTVEAPGDYQHVELRDLPEAHAHAVAFGGPWNALPRPPREESTTNPVYVKQVRGLLDKAGLKGATVHLNQVLRVDLDGDGSDEVLVSATTPREHYPPPNIVAGDYSLVLLRQVKRGRVVTTVLQSSYHTRPATFAAPQAYDVLGTLDLDHDGKQEILVRWRYYEGEGVAVYQLKDGKPVEVLNAGEGA